MKNRSVRTALLALCLCACAGAAHAAPLKVVATTTTFADLVSKIGGARVETYAVAPPRFNIHYVQPRPSDVRRVARADLYVSAGLDQEAWSDPLLEAAGRPALFRGGERHLDLSRGIRLLDVPNPDELTRAEGDIHLFGNPHYQLDPRNGRVMAEAIAAKLGELDPEGAAGFDANLAAFAARLDAKLAEWKAACPACEGAPVVSYHKDIAYFADFLGLVSEAFLEPKPGVPPTPRQLAALEAYVRENRVKALVQPVYYSQEIARGLAARTGAKLAIVCQNVGEVEGTGDYFALFDHNVQAVREALA